MGSHFDRAWVLFRQSRWGLAEQELTRNLEQDPGHALSHALLALCVLERHAHAQAMEHARRAVGLDPDGSFSHYALSRAYLQSRRFPEAEAAIREALRLDGTTPLHFFQLASVLSARHHFTEALAAVEQGLHYDPADADGQALRAQLLLVMGRTHDAALAMTSSLTQEPENAVSHSTRGWLLLQDGMPDRALEAFREALRLQPDLEHARRGLIEALKARSRAYRVFLRYRFWLRSWLLSRKARLATGLLAGAVYYALASMPATEAVAEGLLYFLLLTLLLPALSTLGLRCTRDGRLALSADEVAVSTGVGICAGLALVGVGKWLVLDDGHGWLVALCWFTMAIPWSQPYDVPAGRFRRILLACAWLLSLWIAVPLGLLLFNVPAPAWVYYLGFIGIVGSMVLGSLLKRRPLV